GLRGGRPNGFYIDDPEHDEKASTSMEDRREYMQQLIFGVVMPMVMQPGCWARWLATFVSKRHYAWAAMETVVDQDGTIRAKDPRYEHWHRMLIPAAREGPDGKIISCWTEMWPSTREEKKANPALKDRVSLEEIRELIGPAKFRSEYMGDPG